MVFDWEGSITVAINSHRVVLSYGSATEPGVLINLILGHLGIVDSESLRENILAKQLHHLALRAATSENGSGSRRLCY